MPNWPLRVIKMSINKRKKTLFSGFLLIGLVYTIVQLTYYQQAYSPLRVLANAESEARRLLKFITLYHYQCNSTIGSGNGTAWRLCAEPDVGVNVDSTLPKIAYSIGPMWDYGFETLLSRNYSFQQYIFLHYSIPVALRKLNGTHIFKTVIVPNDPADFGRNSYETQTLNSITKKLGHGHIDIIKLEAYLDMSDSHEVLFFLVKDKLLRDVQQLHIVLDIDKIDDDYLYNWYRSLYVLFHEAGFRLYHTSASDHLCLQVTMMESCRYFMSWVKNPGPRTFILYPPAIDGSYELEEKRILDFLEPREPNCHDNSEFMVTGTNGISLCDDMIQKKSQEPCNIFIFGDKPVAPPSSLSNFKSCTVTTILPIKMHDSFDFKVRSHSPRDKSSSQTEVTVSLSDLVSQHLLAKHINIIYISLPHLFWDIITPMLDMGALEFVDQITADIVVFDSLMESSPMDIRRKYSELRRIEAYKFQLYEITKFTTKTLHFQQQKSLFGECCYRVAFIKSNF
ncbi:uncharacterized protein [Haliotis asinina]|uniref:uncharacterized protein n=1 Tax=Haliotis asinina TaxID=109174 RepID=UPI003532579D